MKTLKIVLLFIILVMLLILAIAIESDNHKKVIKIAVGSKIDAYTQYAKKYAKEFEKEGVTLKLVETKGSVQAQAFLQKDKVDFAFVQGGTENSNVYALANILYEPIWIFYKGKQLHDLKELKGKRIAICEKGSGILPVTLNLLDSVGINGFNSHFKYIPSSKAYRELKSNKIDAMFYIASADAPFLKRLMSLPHIHLLNFMKSSNSYKQFFVKRNKHFEIVTLYKNAFDMEEQIPRRDHKLLAKNTLLATYNASDKMVRLMLKIAKKVHSKVGVFHEENTFPNASQLKIKQHPASKIYFRNPTNYYEEHFPYWIAETLAKADNYFFRFILPLIALFAFFIEVVLPTLDIYGKSKINRWYNKINEIDTEILTLNLHEAKSRREQLRNILAEIRNTDEISSKHMADFYTLQNQIVNILDDVEKHIKTLHHGHKGF